MAKHITLAFGRFNPVHVGHEGLVNKVKSVAKKHGGVARVYHSHSNDQHKNPLDYETKHKLLHHAFGDVIHKHASRGFIDVLKHASSEGHEHLHLVAGKDRHPEYKKLIDKYNGKDFNFKSVSYHVPPRGYSATKMREHATSGDHESFKNHLPIKLRDQSHEIFHKVRKGLGIKENFYGTVSTTQNVDVLLNVGLGERDRLSIYRKVLLDPWGSFMNQQYRPMLVHMFKRMTNIIFGNRAIYDRVRWDLVHSKNMVASWSSGPPSSQIKEDYFEEAFNDRAIDLLISLGLYDTKKAVLARRVIRDPNIAINDSTLRKTLLDLFIRFRNLIILDPYIYSRSIDYLRSLVVRESKYYQELERSAKFYGKPTEPLVEILGSSLPEAEKINRVNRYLTTPGSEFEKKQKRFLDFTLDK